MQRRTSNDSHDLINFVRLEGHNLHGIQSASEFLNVVHVLHGGAVALVEVIVAVGIRKEVVLLLIRRSTLRQLVEDVEASLFVSLTDDSALFEQIAYNGSSREETSSVEVQFDEFTETGGVVVSCGLGVTESWKEE